MILIVAILLLVIEAIAIWLLWRQKKKASDALKCLEEEVPKGAIFMAEQMDAQISIWIRAERERCARVAESVGPEWGHCGAQIAQTIRSVPANAEVAAQPNTPEVKA